MSRRSDRRRYGHSLLFVVGLALIVVISAWLATTPAPPVDWTCDQTDAAARAIVSECVDVDY